MLACILCCLKQRVAICQMNFYSILLFLSSGFCIYLSVCLYKDLEVLGGLLSEEDPETEVKKSSFYFESYINLILLVISIIALILALFGCCTAKTRDCCSVCSFTLLGIVMLTAFCSLSLITMYSHHKSFEQLQSFCANMEYPESGADDLDFLSLIQETLEKPLYEQGRDLVDRFDSKISSGIETYMCKSECRCSSEGLTNLDKWPRDQQTELKDANTYYFDGTIKSYFECYTSLKNEGKLEEQDLFTNQELNLIKDFEKNLECLGICDTPRFWFFEKYYEGPPSSTCITEFKQEMDSLDGFIGYTMLTMTVLVLFQLLSLCGICRSSDRCLNSDKNLNPQDEAVEVNPPDQPEDLDFRTHPDVGGTK